MKQTVVILDARFFVSYIQHVI